MQLPQLTMCGSKRNLQRMDDPAHLLPLADLPMLITSKEDVILYNDACIDQIQSVSRAIVKTIQETLSYLTKRKARNLVVNALTLLMASLIITAISTEHLMDATKLLMTGHFFPHPQWPSMTLLMRGKLQQQVVMATFSSKILAIAATVLGLLASFILIISWSDNGGLAWSLSRVFSSPKALPTPNGPRGWPILGSWTLMQGSNAHRELAKLAWTGGATTRKLMALSIGTTRIALTSDPAVAKELLRSSVFGDRPLKQAALNLGFDRAIGFSPQGPYWRILRKISVTHMFSHKQIVRNYDFLQSETSRMISAIAGNKLPTAESRSTGLCLRPYLQRAAVNNVMSIVFGRTFDFNGLCPEAEAVEAMIREGFELLGGFNCADHLPLLRHLPFLLVAKRCRELTRRVKSFVQPILEERRRRNCCSSDSFVDVVLELQGDQKLPDDDMISVLWEMVFRGTDTIAVLMEWAMAEVILNPSIQAQIHKELDTVVGSTRLVQLKDMEQLPYVQAVLKETLRSHPPGPLLSWARLASEDTEVASYHVPRDTTAMVNMWAITHDATLWPNPHVFDPSRFLEDDLDVLGTELRLAPFGSGRRVCPGRALGMATAQLWLARLLHHFSWSQDCRRPIDLTDNLKLSCEMASPLHGCATKRIPLI